MSPVKAVLFDRDGTLVHDVPYNGDPARVRPVEGAREALALLRRSGIRTGVVTNQSGIARGLLTDADVRHVNRRIDELLGPFDVWAVCPHGPDDGCHCRKPQPGLVLWAAGRICTAPGDCVVIGDIGADVEAAERAGAHGILVPNRQTRPEETSAAGHVAPDLLTAVRAVLHGPPRGRVLVDERPIEAAYTTDTGAFESAPAPARGRPATGKAGNTPGPRRGDSTDGAGAGSVASEAWGSGAVDGDGHGSDVGRGGPFTRGGGAGSEPWGSGVVGGGSGSGFGRGGPVARGGGAGSEPWGSGVVGGGSGSGFGRGGPVARGGGAGSEPWGSGSVDGGGHGSGSGPGGPVARGGEVGSEPWGSGSVDGGGHGSGSGPGGPVARGGEVGPEPWGSGGGCRFGFGWGVPVDGGGPTGSGTSDLRRPR